MAFDLCQSWDIILPLNTVRLLLGPTQMLRKVTYALAAVEGVTQALSMELDPSWNIKVSRDAFHMPDTIYLQRH